MTTQNPQLPMPVNRDTINYFLAHMIRMPSIYRFGQQHLTADLFESVLECDLILVWEALQTCMTRQRELPNKVTLTAMMLGQAERMGIDEEIRQQACGFIEWVFAWEDDQFDNAMAVDYFRAFLHDRKLGALMFRTVNARKAGVADFPRSVEDLRVEARNIAAIGNAAAVCTLGDGLQEYLQRVERLRGHKIIGMQSGLQILDDRLCGLRGLILLGAGPGVGKTVFAVQMAIGVCKQSAESVNDACVLYVSLDMSADDVRHRVMCNLSEIDWATFRLGSPDLRRNATGPHFTDGHQQQIDQAIARLSEWQIDRRLAIVGREDCGGLDAAHLAGLVANLKERSGARRCLVVVDYLQLIEVPDKVAREGDLEADKFRMRLVQQLVDASRNVDSEAQDCVLAVSEARKPSTSTGKDKWAHRLEDLMGSARIGYAADAVILMRRSEDDESCGRTPAQFESEGISPLVITLAKGRDGMTRGSWDVEFHYRRSQIIEGSSNRPQATREPEFQRQRPTPAFDPQEAGANLDVAH